MSQLLELKNTFLKENLQDWLPPEYIRLNHIESYKIWNGANNSLVLGTVNDLHNTLLLRQLQSTPTNTPLCSLF